MSQPKRRSRQIAPRLASGDVRAHIGHSLPDDIKAALRVAAQETNRSVSWVLETAIIDYFGLRRPRYKGKPR